MDTHMVSKLVEYWLVIGFGLTIILLCIILLHAIYDNGYFRLKWEEVKKGKGLPADFDEVITPGKHAIVLEFFPELRLVLIYDENAKGKARLLRWNQVKFPEPGTKVIPCTWCLNEIGVRVPVETVKVTEAKEHKQLVAT